ncbi:hypothetical protein JCM16303_004237 [Sporobolomyces ruberrimus]
MDLTKGGLASTPKANTSNPRPSNAILLPSRTKSSEHPSKVVKHIKRKVENASASGGGNEEDSFLSSSSQKKRKVDEVQQQGPAATPWRSTASQRDFKPSSSTSRDKEDSDAMPPPSQVPQNKQQSRWYTDRNPFEEQDDFISCNSPEAPRRAVAPYGLERKKLVGLPIDRPFPGFGPEPSNDGERTLSGEATGDTLEAESEQEEERQASFDNRVYEIPFPEELDSWHGQQVNSSQHSGYFGSRRFPTKSPTPEPMVSSPNPPASEDHNPLNAREDTTRTATSLENQGNQSASPKFAQAQNEFERKVDPLNPIPSLFPGTNPFLAHARALTTSEAQDGPEVLEESTKAEDVVESINSGAMDFAQRFQGILDKTRDLFVSSLSRQSVLVAKLEKHSDALAKEDEQIVETKKRLGSWTGQLLSEKQEENGGNA